MSVVSNVYRNKHLKDAVFEALPEGKVTLWVVVLIGTVGGIQIGLI